MKILMALSMKMLMAVAVALMLALLAIGNTASHYHPFKTPHKGEITATFPSNAPTKGGVCGTPLRTEDRPRPDGTYRVGVSLQNPSCAYDCMVTCMAVGRDYDTCHVRCTGETAPRKDPQKNRLRDLTEPLNPPLINPGSEKERWTQTELNLLKDLLPPINPGSEGEITATFLSNAPTKGGVCGTPLRTEDRPRPDGTYRVGVSLWKPSCPHDCMLPCMAIGKNYDTCHLRCTGETAPRKPSPYEWGGAAVGAAGVAIWGLGIAADVTTIKKHRKALDDAEHNGYLRGLQANPRPCP